jgi:TPR repeat protein
MNIKLFQVTFPLWVHRLALAVGAVLVVLEITMRDIMARWDIPVLCVAVLYTIVQFWLTGYWKGRIDEDIERRKNWRRLFDETKVAAESGDVMAQLNLGICYGLGQGIAKDDVQAVKWWRKAAEQNLAQAQSNLGVCYAKGQGVAKDAVEAVKWYRRAAEQNDADAQHNLGFCYAIGNGVAKDEVEAVKWYRKAAEQNLAKSQHNLGNCYFNGDGVAKDNVEAYKWFILASGQGIKESQTNLSAMRPLMTPEQIAEAQRLVREFKPTETAESPDFKRDERQFRKRN